MESTLTYERIYKTLFSKGIEEYIPDGISISHPVLDIVDGNLVDCFLLYATSRDGSKYTSPTARIVINAEKGKLVKYSSTENEPFLAYDGTDYFENRSDTEKTDIRKICEEEYQRLYMAVRDVAFRDKVTPPEKILLANYIKSLKATEYIYLQPFLYELGNRFFQWAKRMLRQ